MSVEAPEAIRKTVVVSAPVEKAWRVFTEEIGSWWPLAANSLSGEDCETIVLDSERIYERAKDGTEHPWGRVLVWEPPKRVAFTWELDPEGRIGNEVEVTFIPEGGGTRVELEHRGWSEGTEESRKHYGDGWSGIMARYEATAGG
jgi:uncharacterized protein YndB with AHSA1/START domain